MHKVIKFWNILNTTVLRIVIAPFIEVYEEKQMQITEKYCILGQQSFGLGNSTIPTTIIART